MKNLIFILMLFVAVPGFANLPFTPKTKTGKHHTMRNKPVKNGKVYRLFHLRQC